MEIKVPRDRDGSFEPQIVKNMKKTYQTLKIR